MIKISLFIIFLLLLPAIVIGESSCDSEEEHSDKSLALKYKIGAIASIIMVSAIGVCLPMLGKFMPALEPKKDIFFIIKAFAAGVILSTAFVHVLPDAIKSLTSPCLNEHPWRKFPFSGFVAMLSAIGTLMIDSFATSYYTRCNLRKTDEENVNDNGAHTHATHAHSHSMIMVDNSVSSEFLRHRVISQVLELGIVVHSVIIGVSLGASQSPKAIKPLLVALIFHQFFEGMGLGVCIAQAKLKGRAIVIMALFFSLTTPIGIGIGIVISNGYQENDPRALIVEGIFDAASSGILIYMSLVDLLAADFMDLKVQSNTKLQFGVNLFLLLGVACMSILAKWA